MKIETYIYTVGANATFIPKLDSGARNFKQNDSKFVLIMMVFAAILAVSAGSGIFFWRILCKKKIVMKEKKKQ